MKSKVIFFAVLLMFLFSGCSPVSFIEKYEFKTDREMGLLQGQVKSCTVLVYSNQGLVKGAFASKSVYKFLSDGQQKQKAEYNEYGSLKYKYITKFDKNDTASDSVEYDAQVAPVYRILYKYDSLSNLIEEKKINSDGNETAKIQYIFDSSSCLIRKEISTGFPFLKKVFTIFYSNELPVSCSNSGLFDQNSVSWEYGKNSKIQKMDLFNKNAQRTFSVEYLYNAKEQVIQQSHFEISQKFGEENISLVRTVLFLYDYIGNPVEEKLYEVSQKFGENVSNLIVKTLTKYEYY